jgi:DNA-binding transcriptional regulator WhiA
MKQFISDLNLSHKVVKDIDYFSEVPFVIKQKRLDSLRKENKYNEFVSVARNIIEREAVKKGFIEF